MKGTRTPKQPLGSGERVIVTAFRRSLVAIAAIAVVAALVSLALHLAERDPDRFEEVTIAGPREPTASASTAPPRVAFEDITEEAGVDFVHFNGAYGDKLLPETMGGGVAFLDYDNDGDADLLFVNSSAWPERAPADVPAPTMGLYRNDGTGRFDDVTRDSGLDVSLYGMGVAVADYDGDGHIDVFISVVGENRLYRNMGERFEDVTATAGVGGTVDDWSTGSAFFDYDNDGDLDLYVGNYVRWSAAIDFGIDFRLTGIGRAYGPPTSFEGSHGYLYRNEGDGTFRDVSVASGIQIDNPATGRPMGKALGVLPMDVDGDGWVDLFVANDTVRNFFFHNRGGGEFHENGIDVGVSFDRNGSATGAMGVDGAFYRNDRDIGFVVGNFANEMTSFYVGQGELMLFSDEAIVDGIGPATRLALTFGAFFFDYDLDGRLDLFQANGHLEEDINQVQTSQHYQQLAQLFWNCGPVCAATFVEVDGATSGDLRTPLVGRGAAYADIDGDGDLDLVVTQSGRRPMLLRNNQVLGNHWVRLALRGRGANPDAIGARIELEAGGAMQRRHIAPTRSYLSQVELAVTFGLGKIDTVERVRIRWPDGSVQELTTVAVDTTTTIEQEP